MELKLGEIKFDEIYLDEKPKDNYWRGIIATINNITLLRIPLEENYCGSRHDILYVSPVNKARVFKHVPARKHVRADAQVRRVQAARKWYGAPW